MKKFLILGICLIGMSAMAQYKQDGTPDRRYKQNDTEANRQNDEFNAQQKRQEAEARRQAAEQARQQREYEAEQKRRQKASGY